MCCTNMSPLCSFGLSGRHAIPSVEMKNVYLLQECNAPSPSKWEAERDRRASVISHDATQIKAIGTYLKNKDRSILH